MRYSSEKQFATEMFFTLTNRFPFPFSELYFRKGRITF